MNDIPLLAGHFALSMSLEMQWDHAPSFSEQAMSELKSFAWPGNIRELKNVVERAVYKSDSRLITHIDFDPFSASFLPAETPSPPQAVDHGAESVLCPAAYEHSEPNSLPQAIAALEVQALQSALNRNHFHQGKSAQALGISYDQFRRLMRKHKDAL